MIAQLARCVVYCRARSCRQAEQDRTCTCVLVGARSPPAVRASPERGGCGQPRVASNLHFMAEGERAGGHSDQVPPIADEVGGAAPSAPAVQLTQAKSDTASGMRRRIAVVIALLVAVLLLYVGLL